MTSNMGSSLIRENFETMTAANREQVIEKTRIQILELLKKTIRPEFLNRIDEVIMFTPLDENEILQIVGLQLQGIQTLLEKNGIEIRFTGAAESLIAEKGFDPQFGARPVKRVIQALVLNELSKQILGATIDRSRPIVIDAEKEGLVFGN
jgi:ATP-dependent Clp protease ATP-binding subunit ClpB